MQRYFRGTGALVLLIFIFCFASTFYVFDNLMHNPVIAVPVAMFFAWMITNLYMLLLYSLSKSSFPHTRVGAERLVSLVLRLVFVVLIAVVMAKPLEVWIFSSSLERDIAAYKQETYLKYIEQSNDYFNDQVRGLQEVLSQHIPLTGDEKSLVSSEYQNLIDHQLHKKDAQLKDMRLLISESNYFFRRIVILIESYPQSWTITLLIIAVFLMPILLKHVISVRSMFHSIKKDLEMGLVIREYEQFKIRYAKEFNRHQSGIKYSEPYEDAPFNTKRKLEKIKFLSEEDLLNQLYN